MLRFVCNSSSISSLSSTRMLSCCVIKSHRRFQSTPPEPQQEQQSLFQTLTFPEAYTQFRADEELEKSSINTVGTIVPHHHQAERNKKFRLNSEPSTIRAWVSGVPVDREALVQLDQLSSMGSREGVIQHPIVVMPDVHCAQAATVGTVIPTTHALIPAAAGVDLGCGVMIVKTSLKQHDLPGDLEVLRLAIELAVPHGRTHNGDPANDAGGWRGNVPRNVARVWKQWLEPDFKKLCVIRPELESTNSINHLCTLGTGNHFASIAVDDETKSVWIFVHSGSRGVGNKIGAMYIEQAKKDMGQLVTNLPNADLAYLKEGTQNFDDYCFAVDWAQRYAQWNRELMVENIVAALRATQRLPPFTVSGFPNGGVGEASALEKRFQHLAPSAAPFSQQLPFQELENDSVVLVDCHHNYITRQTILVDEETGERQEVLLTRKGATSARKNEYAIIPGSMGAKSYIVRGRGNEASYCSCSHGAGRRYSRGETTRRFTLEDHVAATQGVACRKDKDVIDETPMAYKNLDAVMAAQLDCVEIVYTLREVVCVKG